MKHKVLISKGSLISGVAIAFLLMSNEGKTESVQPVSSKVSQKDIIDIGENHSLNVSNGIEEIKNELNGTKSLDSLQLDFRLVGTIIAGDENSYAVIEDETTGKQGIYKLGESINEATVLKIDKKCIIVKKDGRSQILKITGGSYTEVVSLNGPPSIGISEKLPPFKPIVIVPNPTVIAPLGSEKELPDE